MPDIPNLSLLRLTMEHFLAAHPNLDTDLFVMLYRDMMSALVRYAQDDRRMVALMAASITPGYMGNGSASEIVAFARELLDAVDNGNLAVR